jgi:hypothetical protein
MSLRRDESTPSFSKAKDGGLTVVRSRLERECEERGERATTMDF